MLSGSYGKSSEGTERILPINNKMAHEDCDYYCFLCGNLKPEAEGWRTGKRLLEYVKLLLTIWAKGYPGAFSRSLVKCYFQIGPRQDFTTL